MLRGLFKKTGSKKIVALKYYSQLFTNYDASIMNCSTFLVNASLGFTSHPTLFVPEPSLSTTPVS